MTPKAKAEFEAVLDDLLNHTGEEELLRLIEGAEGGVYRASMVPVFSPVTVSLSVSRVFAASPTFAPLNVVPFEFFVCAANDYEDLLLAV